MSNCANCGAPLGPSDTVCPSCGHIAERPAANPYEPSEALMYDAEAVAEEPAPGWGEYGIPFGVGSVIGGAFRLWSAVLGRLVLISLIPYAVMVPLGIVTGVLAYFSSQDDSYLVATIVAGVITFLASLPVTLAAAAGSYLILEDHARHGLPQRGIGEAFGQGFHFFWRFLGVSLLMGLVVGGIGALAAALWALLWAVGLVATLAAIPAIIYLVVRWAAAMPAIAVEDVPGIGGLSRSADLVRGRWWPVFGILVLYFLIVLGIQIVTSLVGLIPVFGFIASIVVSLLVGALTFAILFALYASLRDSEGARP